VLQLQWPEIDPGAVHDAYERKQHNNCNEIRSEYVPSASGQKVVFTACSTGKLGPMPCLPRAKTTILPPTSQWGRSILWESSTLGEKGR
jgi:hypothetical protein